MVRWQLLRQQVTQIMLARDSKSRILKVKKFIFGILSTEISSPWKNSFGKTIGVLKLPQQEKDQCLPLAAREV